MRAFFGVAMGGSECGRSRCFAEANIVQSGVKQHQRKYFPAMSEKPGLQLYSALENVPVQARGLCSGILQQGYAVGYLIAAVINLGVVSKSPYTWRSIYFFGAGLSTFAAIVRACLPESRQFIDARRIAKESGVSSADQSKAFMRELKNMLKSNCEWLAFVSSSELIVLSGIRCIWGVCFMTGFNVR